MSESEHSSTERDGLRIRTQSVYRRHGVDSAVLLYSGDVRIDFDGQVHVCSCDVRVERDGGRLVAFVAGDEPWLAGAMLADEVTVKVVDGACLDPPSEPLLSPAEVEAASVSWPISLNRHQTGAIQAASVFVVHINAQLEKLPRNRVGEAIVEAVDFDLPGWQVRLVKLEEANDAYTHIANATPVRDVATVESVEELRWRLHILLGVVASQQAGIGAIAGLDDCGAVRWVDWCAARDVGSQVGARWCTEPVHGAAIRAIADGYTRLTVDPALTKSVERAISYYMSAAGGREVLDIRVPVACIGIEILGWALLQRNGWLGVDALNKMPEGAVARVLMKSCGIPVEIPANLPRLQRRLKSIGIRDWAGPELVFKVRNELVHPPRKLDQPEWPDSELLLEAWQLSTWYLELALLRTLGYKGKYWSRLKLGRNVYDIEPVPWAICSEG